MSERSDFPVHKVKRIMVVHHSPYNKYTERDRTVEKKASIDYDKFFDTFAYMYTKLALECAYKKEELVKQASFVGGALRAAIPAAAIYGLVGKSHVDERNGKAPGLGTRLFRKAALPLSLVAGAASLSKSIDFNAIGKSITDKALPAAGNFLKSAPGKIMNAFKKTASDDELLRRYNYHESILKNASDEMVESYLKNFDNNLTDSLLIGAYIFDRNTNN